MDIENGYPRFTNDDESWRTREMKREKNFQC